MVLLDPANKLAGKFTIPEGLSMTKTLAKLAEQTGIPLADFQAAIKDPAALGITADWFVRQDGKPARRPRSRASCSRTPTRSSPELGRGRPEDDGRPVHQGRR